MSRTIRKLPRTKSFHRVLATMPTLRQADSLIELGRELGLKLGKPHKPPHSNDDLNYAARDEAKYPIKARFKR